MQQDQPSGIYKTQARKMLDLAQVAITEETRKSYLELATKWMRLAESSEANTSIGATREPEKKTG